MKNNLKINNNVLIKLIIILSIGLFASVEIYTTLNRITQSYQHVFMLNNAVRDLTLNLNNIQRHIEKLVFVHQNNADLESALKTISKDEKQIDHSLALINQDFKGDKLAHFRVLLTAWQPIRSEIMALTQADNRQQAIAMLALKEQEHFDRIAIALHHLVALADQKADGLIITANHNVNKIYLWIVCLFVIVIIIDRLFLQAKKYQPQSDCGCAEDKTLKHPVLLQSDCRYRAILEEQTELVCRFLPDTTLTFVNKAYCRYFGVQESDILGQKFLSMVPETAHQDVLKHIHCLLKNPQPTSLTYEHPVKTPNGKIAWQRWTDNAIVDQEGQILEIQSVGIDITDRKQMEEQLKQTTEQLSLLLEHLPIVPYMSQVENHAITYINKRIKTVSGYEPEAFLSNASFWADLMHPDDKPTVFENRNQLFEKEILELEYRWQVADGSYKWCLDTLRLVKNADGTPNHIVGTWHDITQRKKMEEALRENEKTLSAIVNGCVDTIGLVDENGTCITINSAGAQKLGFSVEELVGQCVYDFMPYEVAEKRRTVINKVIETGKAILIDEDKRGEFWFETNYCPVFDEKGVVTRVAAIARDVTERKQAEQALQRSQVALEQAHAKLTWFKTSLDMTLDCLFMIESQTLKFFYANQGATKLLGYTQEELLQMTIADIGYLSMAPDCHKPLEKLMDSQPGLTFESVFVHKNTTLIQVEIFAQCIQLPEITKSFLIIARDISLRKKVEEQLQQAKETAEVANRAKSTFLANMSHEIRTPLNGVLGYTQLLQRDKTLTAAQQKAIDVIHRSGEYLLTLINDILEIAKIEADRIELYSSDFDLNAFIKDIVDLFKIRTQEKGIFFHYQALSKLPQSIHADEKRLRQILINLLGNSVKFTKQGGITLKISVIEQLENEETKQEWEVDEADQMPNSQIPIPICFEVEDTGVGIAIEDINKIFLPFQQVGDHHDKAQGTGLGLTLTKKLIQLMGGELQVESTLGQGSRFWMVLEVSEGKINLNQPSKGPSVIGFEGPARKILIVDDSLENCLLLSSLLMPLGFEIKEAHNGQQCLEKVCEWQPDLILMDLLMPVMDGYEATRKIKQIPLLKKTIIVAISASAFDYHKRQSQEAGCDDFIAKPIYAEKLLNCLRKHLNLTYVYEPHTDQANRAGPQTDVSLIGPNVEQATALFNLTLQGDLDGIVEYVEQLQQQDKQLAPFAHKIQQLAQQFKIQQIRDIVKYYVDKG